jgi:hypothetical protein
MNEKLISLIQEAKKAKVAYLAQYQLVYYGPTGYNGRYSKKLSKLYLAMTKIETQIIKEIYI